MARAEDARISQELADRAAVVRKYADAIQQSTKQSKEYADAADAIEYALKSNDPAFKAQINNIEDLGKVAEMARNRSASFRDEESKAAEQREIDIQRTKARTDGEKAAVAARQAVLDQSGKLITSEGGLADVQHKVSMQYAETAAAVRNMTLSQELEAAAVQKEINLLGLSTGERERALAVQKAQQDLIRMGTDATTAEGAAYVAAAERLAILNQERKAATLMRDVMFEREQLGRSPEEQAIASRIRGAGLDGTDAGERLAAQMRLNATLTVTRDLTADVAKNFVKDLQNGVTAAEALSNAFQKIADKLMDMAMNDLVGAAFGGIGGKGGGLTSLISGMFDGGGGGFTGTGAVGSVGASDVWMHSGGLVGRDYSKIANIHPAYFDDAPRLHNGLRPDEVPTILQKGEWVLNKGDVRTIQQAASGGGGGVSVTYAPVVDARGSQMGEAEFRAILTQNNRALKEALPGMINDARQRSRMR
jgi:hypothetical protein